MLDTVERRQDDDEETRGWSIYAVIVLISRKSSLCVMRNDLLWLWCEANLGGWWGLDHTWSLVVGGSNTGDWLDLVLLL
jgi:hypothetical protein